MSMMTGLMKTKIMIAMAIVLLETESGPIFSAIDS
jgi:hypothetical protein